MSKIRVVVVDDHTILRQVLAKSLNAEFDIEVAGSFNNAEKALEFLEKESINVIIMDYKMPGITGAEASRILLKKNPDLKIIILSAFTGDDEVFASIEAGALGYLPKEVTMEALVGAIRTVNQGNAVLDPSITLSVLEKFSGMKRKLSKKNLLTENEKEVLNCASRGDSYKIIADKMKTNENEIKAHFRSIHKKLDTIDKAHAVATALREGLI